MFDSCDHEKRLLIIRAAKLLREAKGLPEEKNVSLLFQEAAPLFGIIPVQLSTKDVSHLPTPEESAKELVDERRATANAMKAKLIQICPACGEKSYYLRGICKSCKESENEKYKTMWQCFKCKHFEKSEDPVVVWFERLGVDFGTQTKESLGIKTITDEGLK